MNENLDEKAIEELARNERLAYFKKWRAEHKNIIKEYNKRYWSKRAEKRALGKTSHDENT